MSAEEIKQELYVSPKDTNAFKLTKISVYEDRPAAVAMGAVGIGVLASVIIFIVLLDCQQMVKLCSKEQKTATKWKSTVPNNKGTSCLSCLEWVSSLDGKYRKHCYWFNRISSRTAFEADEYCAQYGGRLAPYIDSYQFNFLLKLRPPTAVETYIGTMDVIKEDTWVNFDGSSIPGNEFLFTMTNYPVSQPNGDTDQNCAVINSKSHGGVYHDNQTQDKECSFTTTDMLCYMEDWTRQCLSWNSTADQKHRRHCYWMTSKAVNQTTWSVKDAMDKCRCEGGQLSPVIDDSQFSFITNLIRSIANSTGINTELWLGVHNIKGTPRNWNIEPMAAAMMTAPSGELCFLTSTDGTQLWRQCSFTDPSFVSGALCFKEGFVSSAIRPKSSFNGNTTITSIEEIIKELHVNPRDTNAFKLTKISVYEDRPVAVCMGGIGIAVLTLFFVFIVLLDCQRLENLCSKQKTAAMETKN
ncbi:uncharacterized protein LOC134271678 [Saccostrea cucullata]|uniref:uncharacterized protein LOC134271678 n=1 Tax=Saccostrea cuccullata TaxID=36930 RepID=UPI002ED42671